MLVYGILYTKVVVNRQVVAYSVHSVHTSTGHDMSVHSVHSVPFSIGTTIQLSYTTITLRRLR